MIKIGSGAKFFSISTTTTTKDCFFFKKWAEPGLFFLNFRSFHITNWILNDKNIDSVLGTRTRIHMMVGAGDTTDLWRPPNFQYVSPLGPSSF